MGFLEDLSLALASNSLIIGIVIITSMFFIFLFKIWLNKIDADSVRAMIHYSNEEYLKTVKGIIDNEKTAMDGRLGNMEVRMAEAERSLIERLDGVRAMIPEMPVIPQMPDLSPYALKDELYKQIAELKDKFNHNTQLIVDRLNRLEYTKEQLEAKKAKDDEQFERRIAELMK